jgi:hypothetical protein
VSFYVSTAIFFLLHCDEWDRVVALPRHKFVTGATLLQLVITREEYAQGNTLFGFDLTPDMSEVGAFQLIKQGNLRVEIHFAEALTATINVIFLLHCDEWDRVVALPRHKFVTGATLLQLVTTLASKRAFRVLLFFESYSVKNSFLLIVDSQVGTGYPSWTLELTLVLKDNGQKKKDKQP